MNIPNLPVGKIVDEDGMPTDQELTFRQNLVSELQDNASDEGLVIPTQSTTNITNIQNHTIPNPADPMNPIYTCQFGTFLYDSNTNEIKVAIDDGSGIPIFKVVQLM